MYILVVEDDPHIQALVCSTLQADGHSVDIWQGIQNSFYSRSTHSRVEY